MCIEYEIEYGPNCSMYAIRSGRQPLAFSSSFSLASCKTHSEDRRCISLSLDAFLLNITIITNLDMLSAQVCTLRWRVFQFCYLVTVSLSFVVQIQYSCRTVVCEMVRNIDLPEALILYGAPVIFDDDKTTWRSGLDVLVDQCKLDEAAVIMLVEDEASIKDNIKQRLSFPEGDLQLSLIETVIPPNPRDLLMALEAVTIQPKAFGGSSGFGRRQHLDPERHPLPQRAVVLTHTLDQTRAARCAGMRVVRLIIDANEDDHLADLVVGDEVDFYIDDIATPGSFWLNPPHPRDDWGNRVDSYEIAAQGMGEKIQPKDKPASPSSDELTEEDLQRMLADIDPL